MCMRANLALAVEMSDHSPNFLDTPRRYLAHYILDIMYTDWLALINCAEKSVVTVQQQSANNDEHHFPWYLFSFAEI